MLLDPPWRVSFLSTCIVQVAQCKSIKTHAPGGGTQVKRFVVSSGHGGKNGNRGKHKVLPHAGLTRDVFVGE